MRGSTIRFFKLFVLTILSVALCFFVMVNWVNQPWQSDNSDSGPNHMNLNSKFEDPILIKRQTAPLHEMSDENDTRSHQLSSKSQVKNTEDELKDWNDRRAILNQLLREGPGEFGKRAFLNNRDKESIEKQKLLIEELGFNALLSERISLNRSIPDMRDEGCKSKKHLANLPKVSVIIPFENEHWSTLLRTCYSIILRTPPELLEEIILVDNNSTKEFLGEKLDLFITMMVEKTQVVRVEEKVSMAQLRLIGAEQAISDFYVFLDPNIEISYNWLPPLLEPIVRDSKTCVIPFVDTIDPNTFQYRATDTGMRHIIDWDFKLHHLQRELKKKKKIDKTENYPNPIIGTGTFAIQAEFFWSLGGYDEDLESDGSEQIELSFKIWLCGGRILTAPCSRLGKLKKLNQSKSEISLKDRKRIVEVWMQGYKTVVYSFNAEQFAAIDAGDLTNQTEIRKELKCKPFQFFFKNVAIEFFNNFPSKEPPYYAYGSLRNEFYPKLCLEQTSEYNVSLSQCPESQNDTTIPKSQYWIYTHNEKVRGKHRSRCLCEPEQRKVRYALDKCHENLSYWLYDLKTKWIWDRLLGLCLEANPTDNNLVIRECKEDNEKLRWTFSKYNETANDFYQERHSVLGLIGTLKLKGKNKNKK